MGLVLSIINKYSKLLAPTCLLIAGTFVGAQGAMAGPATDVTLLSAGNMGLLVGDNVMTKLGKNGSTNGFFTVNGTNSPGNDSIYIGTFNSSSNPDTLRTLTASSLVEGGFGGGCTPTTGGSCGLYSLNGINSVGTPVLSPSTFDPNSSGDPISDAWKASQTAATEATTNFGYAGGLINNAATSETDITSGHSRTFTATNQAADNVFTITNLDLDGGGCLTIDDGSHAGAKFVIDVTGNFTIGSLGCINLASQTTARDVIFNIEGTGSTVSITGGGGAIQGTFLAPDRSVSITNANITGEVIAGVHNLSSGYTVNGFDSTISFVAFSPPGRVPEPGTLALFGGGTAAIALLKRRRARRAS